VFTFKVAIEAGLNIGIAQSIWAISPFFISILERVFYHTPFHFKQIYGMSAIVVGAIFISLSEVITPKEADPTIVAVVDENTVPVWYAIMVSFTMPIVCSLFIIPIKHVNDTLLLDSKDWSIAYWGLASLVFQIRGIVSFLQVENSFDWDLWFNGSIASLFNLLGCVFAIACFSTGAPIGPAAALIGTQTILVVVVTAIVVGEFPSALQNVGLVIGLLGALLLTI